jgi:hypothetical protein
VRLLVRPEASQCLLITWLAVAGTLLQNPAATPAQTLAAAAVAAVATLARVLAVAAVAAVVVVVGVVGLLVLRLSRLRSLAVVLLFSFISVLRTGQL